MARLVSVFIGVSAILLVYVAPASSFDYDSYKPSSLKEIGDIAKEASSKHEGGFEFFIQKLRVRIRLTDYPVEIRKEEFDIGTFNIIELYFKTLRPAFTGDYQKLFTHQLDLQDTGHEFTLLFQGPLVPYVRKEAKLGDPLVLYVIFGISDVSRKRTILLVNEFSAEEGEAKKKFGGLDDLVPRRSLPQYLRASAISLSPQPSQGPPRSKTRSPQSLKDSAEIPWKECIL